MELIFSCCLYGNDKRYIDPLFSNDLEYIQNFLNVNCSFYIYCNNDVEDDVKLRLVKYGYKVIDVDFRALNMGAMFVRYLPIIEELSDIVCVRDTDCCYSDTELVLIKEWLGSKYDFHIIRGHPLHIYPIMGGLFSIRGEEVYNFKKIFHENINLAQSSKYNQDQLFLARKIYPEITNKALVHTVRLAYSNENYIHYNSKDGFIGETILGDEKREKEKEISKLKLKPLVLNQMFSKLTVNRVFARLITMLSKGMR
ncbi:hypothetical protein [Photobacterium leiognathi]|uniref:hypothetical protein n=1 Tax=Photobacterium leiognathi TaxID=553611 RepID=UPI002981BA1B|nr:hypothetical protein [Photobacterium leiognathi]